MKKLVALIVMVACLIGFVGSSFALVSVRGYTRSDGTYVQPHVRTNPDGNPYNNFSYWD
jgi:hypothetical protein